MHPDDHAGGGDKHDVIPVRDQLHAHEQTRLCVEHARFDALAAARLQAVVGGIGALAVAVFGDSQKVAPLAQHEHIDNGIARGERHCPDPHRIAPHRAHVRLREADALTRMRRHDDLVIPGGELHGDEFVPLHDADGDLAAAQNMLELARRRLFDEPVLGRHHQIARAVCKDGQNGGDLLARGELDDIDDRAAACRARRFGNVIALDGVHLAEVGEQQDIVVRGTHEHLLHEVVVLGAVCRDPHAAAVLRAVFGDGDALDVAAVRHGDDHVLLVDEILVLDLAEVDGDLRPARGGIFRLDGEKVGLDDVEHALFIGEDVSQIGDGRLELRKFLLQLLHLEGGEALETHFENGVCLFIGQFKGGGQLGRGVVLVRRFLDDADDFVDVGKREDEPFDNVRALFRLAEVEARAPRDDLLLVREIADEDLPQIEQLGFGAVLHERQQDDAVGHLQVGVFVERIEHHLCVGVLLAFDDDAHPVPARLVADVRDALDALVLDHVRNGLDEHRLVDLIGDLRDDDAVAQVPARAEFLDLALGADDDIPLSRAVRLADAAPAHDDAPRGEVGRGDVVHQLVHRELGIVNEGNGAVDGLREVVRRNVGRHADGNAVRAVDQKIGEARRQNGGLHLVSVEVGEEVHRLLVQIAQHLRREFGKTRLGITHGGRRIAVHRPEVAVSVHEREVDGEVLRKTHQGVVHGRVPVRVEFTQDVTDDTRTLAVVLVVVEPHLVHGVEDAAVNRL